MRWLLAGLVIDILWSSLQGATFYLHVFPKPLVTQWQRAISLRELIRTNRISGLAYEPSWLAGQISTLYLPWLFAALFTRQRATRFVWLEPVLCALSVMLLLATFSRGGLADRWLGDRPHMSAGGPQADPRCLDLVHFRRGPRPRPSLAPGRGPSDCLSDTCWDSFPRPKGIYGAPVDHTAPQASRIS